MNSQIFSWRDYHDAMCRDYDGLTKGKENEANSDGARAGGEPGDGRDSAGGARSERGARYPA